MHSSGKNLISVFFVFCFFYDNIQSLSTTRKSSEKAGVALLVLLALRNAEDVMLFHLATLPSPSLK